MPKNKIPSSICPCQDLVDADLMPLLKDLKWILKRLTEACGFKTEASVNNSPGLGPKIIPIIPRINTTYTMADGRQAGPRANSAPAMAAPKRLGHLA